MADIPQVSPENNWKSIVIHGCFSLRFYPIEIWQIAWRY